MSFRVKKQEMVMVGVKGAISADAFENEPWDMSLASQLAW
jgi:hypothetical protein